MPNTKPVDIDTLLDQAGNEVFKGHHMRSLGPSDSSDTGADMVGTGLALDSTTDRNGTGERASVEIEADVELDLAADRIVTAEEAGLGGGLDQSEEAQLGVTDEEIEAAVLVRLGLDQ